MEFTNLKQKRGIIKRQLTNFQTFLNTLELDVLDRQIKLNIQVRLNKIGPLYD